MLSVCVDRIVSKWCKVLQCLHVEPLTQNFVFLIFTWIRKVLAICFDLCSSFIKMLYNWTIDSNLIVQSIENLINNFLNGFICEIIILAIKSKVSWNFFPFNMLHPSDLFSPLVIRTSATACLFLWNNR